MAGALRHDHQSCTLVAVKGARASGATPTMLSKRVRLGDIMPNPLTGACTPSSMCQHRLRVTITDRPSGGSTKQEQHGGHTRPGASPMLLTGRRVSTRRDRTGWRLPDLGLAAVACKDHHPPTQHAKRALSSNQRARGPLARRCPDAVRTSAERLSSARDPFTVTRTCRHQCTSSVSKADPHARATGWWR